MGINKSFRLIARRCVTRCTGAAEGNLAIWPYDAAVGCHLLNRCMSRSQVRDGLGLGAANRLGPPLVIQARSNTGSQSLCGEFTSSSNCCASISVYGASCWWTQLRRTALRCRAGGSREIRSPEIVRVITHLTPVECDDDEGSAAAGKNNPTCFQRIYDGPSGTRING